MAKRPNDVDTVKITISTTERVRDFLAELVATGLFGKNPAVAAERLITRGIENLIREGTLTSKNRRR